MRALVCPACRTPTLAGAPQAYRCTACGRDYPILCGIPDFRLRPDRYLTLEQERAKAARLHAFGRQASFAQLVEHYYAITDDVPPELAVRFRDYILAGPARAAPILAALGPARPGEVLVDLGCGSGGLLVAVAGRPGTVIGVDIALRWLVICAKRLEEAGIAATLVCADAEALPFPDGLASQVVAGGLLEHVHDVPGAVAAIRRLLRPGGRLWLSAANRFCLGPHASTRVWGIGFLPRRARSRLLLRLKGIDLLRHSQLLAPLPLARRLRAQGFRIAWLRPRQLADGAGGRSGLERVLLGLYRRALRLRPLHRALVLAGPAFELLAEAKGEEHACGSD